MLTAKHLVPGIHATAKRMAWSGETASPISIQQAQEIADRVHGIVEYGALMAAVKLEIMNVTGSIYFKKIGRLQRDRA